MSQRILTTLKRGRSECCMFKIAIDLSIVEVLIYEITSGTIKAYVLGKMKQRMPFPLF